MPKSLRLFPVCSCGVRTRTVLVVHNPNHNPHKEVLCSKCWSPIKQYMTPGGIKVEVQHG